MDSKTFVRDILVGFFFSAYTFIVISVFFPNMFTIVNIFAGSNLQIFVYGFITIVLIYISICWEKVENLDEISLWVIIPGYLFLSSFGLTWKIFDAIFVFDSLSWFAGSGVFWLGMICWCFLVETVGRLISPKAVRMLTEATEEAEEN